MEETGGSRSKSNARSHGEQATDSSASFASEREENGGDALEVLAGDDYGASHEGARVESSSGPQTIRLPRARSERVIAVTTADEVVSTAAPKLIWAVATLDAVVAVATLGGRLLLLLLRTFLRRR